MVPGATKIPCYRLFVDGEEVEVRGREQRAGQRGSAGKAAQAQPWLGIQGEIHRLAARLRLLCEAPDANAV